MWFLNFIPDSLLHAFIIIVLAAGAGLYVIGLLINFIPPLYPYKEMIRIVGTILMVAGVYGIGSYSTEMVWRARMEAAQAQVEKAQVESKAVNSKIKVKIVRQTKIIHDHQVVVRTQIQHDAAKIDANCKLDPAFIKDLNDAAKNPLSGAQ